MRTLFCIIWVMIGLLASSSKAFAQTGGTNSFAFLNLGFNARSLALGTDFITVRDQDLNLGVSNPSLINSSMNKHASTSQATLAGGINYGMISYARNLKNDVTAVGHLRYIDYGKIVQRDEIGIDIGTYKPMDFILGASFAKPFSPKMTVGATVNFIYSALASYSAFGASIDFAGNYFDEDKGFLATMVVKNAGYQIKGYTENRRDPLPVEVQFGISKKLAHAPFRFSILAHSLTRWDLSYNDPTAQPTVDALTGDTIPVPTASFIEKIGRHLTYQLEVLVSKNIHVRTAFDYQKRQEMKLLSRPGASGFSFGVGMYFNKFNLDYGFAVVSRAGYQHMISLSSDLGKWRK